MLDTNSLVSLATRLVGTLLEEQSRFRSETTEMCQEYNLITIFLGPSTLRVTNT